MQVPGAALSEDSKESLGRAIHTKPTQESRAYRSPEEKHFSIPSACWIQSCEPASEDTTWWLYRPIRKRMADRTTSWQGCRRRGCRRMGRTIVEARNDRLGKICK